MLFRLYNNQQTNYRFQWVDYEWLGSTGATTNTGITYTTGDTTNMNLMTNIRPAPIVIPAERALPEIEHPYLLCDKDESSTIQHLIAYAYDYLHRQRVGTLNAQTMYNYFLAHRSTNYLLGKDKWRVTSSATEVVVRATDDSNRRVGARRVGEGNTDDVKEFIKGYKMPPAMIVDQTVHLIGNAHDRMMMYLMYYADDTPNTAGALVQYESLRQLAYDVAMCDGALTLEYSRRGHLMTMALEYMEVLGMIRNKRREAHQVPLTRYGTDTPVADRVRDASIALVHEIFAPFGVPIK